MHIFSKGIREKHANFFQKRDLNLFFGNYTPSIPEGTHPQAQFIDGAFAPVNVSEAGGESLLDMELSFPILHPIDIKLYQTDDIPYAEGDIPTVGFFNDWLDAIDGVSNHYFQ